MRKLIMKMSVSVDGFVGGPNGENDWIFKSSDEQSRAWLLNEVRDTGLIIMGRKTFEEMIKYWPTAPGPLAEAMNAIPKAVFSEKGYTVPPAASSSPAAATWAEARVFNGDLAKGIKEIKSESGKRIIAFGGAEFMRCLIATGLIDEYLLVTHPVMLGSGLPIFTGTPEPLDLKLAASQSFPAGVVANTYHPA